MKRLISLLTLCLSLMAIVTFAADKVEAPDACKHCGMDRTQFANSRMLIEYNNGTTTGTCSIHCMAIELIVNDQAVKSIKVSDFGTKALIPAEQAIWVLGGSKRGVMTMQAKWAFATKEAAENFVKINGGEIVNWNKVLAAAKTETMPKIH